MVNLKSHVNALLVVMKVSFLKKSLSWFLKFFMKGFNEPGSDFYAC